MGRFSLHSGTCLMLLAMLGVATLIRLVLAPRETLRDVRQFIHPHAIRSGLASPFTAPLIIMALTCFVGVVCWTLGLLIRFRPLAGIGVALWAVFLPILLGYLWLLLVVSIIIEVFRPLRRNRPK